MSRYQTITFRCKEEIFNRLEQFALRHGIDRTSAIKLALHYYLNLKLIKKNEGEDEPRVEGREQEAGPS